MAWPDEWFRWAESDGSPRFASRKGFDIAVAGVQDRFNRTPVRTREGPDYAVCGEGVLGYFDNRLWTTIFMVYSDRFDWRSERSGDLDRWSFRIDREGNCTVTVDSWGREVWDMPWKATYSDEGNGHFLAGYMNSPSGLWHLCMSIDRSDLRPDP